jgi:vacuolar-type H+-ATPase subunit I/STV1
MSERLEELEKMRVDLEGFIFEAATASEREKLESLRSEIAADYKRSNELQAKAVEIAAKNQSKIKALQEEAEKLRCESIDLSVEAEVLKQLLSPKQAEVYQLQRAIKDKENVV